MITFVRIWDAEISFHPTPLIKWCTSIEENILKTMYAFIAEPRNCIVNKYSQVRIYRFRNHDHFECSLACWQSIHSKSIFQDSFELMLRKLSTNSIVYLRTSTMVEIK